jgi:ABC-type oligopeptide transport system ATPase subunit
MGEQWGFSATHRNYLYDSKEILLGIKNLTVKFKKGWLRPTFFTALSNISLTIKKGESIGVIGISGSGKSTLAKSICGLIPKYEGNIVFNNKFNGFFQISPNLTIIV